MLEKSIFKNYFWMDIEVGSLANEGVQCKICHDEDEESNMESPCSCSGTLKYAHRECVQRWCNEKGDTICEICHQQFKPGYTVTQPSFQCGGTPMNFRGSWEIPRRDLHNFHFVSVAPPADHNILDPHFHEYSTSYSRNLMCCRVIAIIFLLLVSLRLSLPVIIYSSEQYPLSSSAVPVLKIVGVLLPMYFIFMAYTGFQRRLHLPDYGDSSIAMARQENDFRFQPPQLHMMI